MKAFRLIAIILAIYLVIFSLSRHPLIVDDAYPGNSCNSLLKKADIIYVIPLMEDHFLMNNPKWCSEIRSLNKTIGLHGIRHSYHEFNNEISKEGLLLAIQSFEQCFGYKPKLFRPPYNLISNVNHAIIDEYNITVYSASYITHPYCHCNPGSYMKPLNWILFC